MLFMTKTLFFRKFPLQYLQIHLIDSFLIYNPTCFYFQNKYLFFDHKQLVFHFVLKTLLLTFLNITRYISLEFKVYVL